jgi:glycerophosphoryl diester phosphodiesterase
MQRAQGALTRPYPEVQYPLLFGHRGCCKSAPENTLAAFRKVLDFGIPGVELDVHLCKTGELVVSHDFNLKRVTGFDSIIEETAYETIAELDAGAWFAEEFRGEKIPLLTEVLDLMGDKVYYDIEIKTNCRKCGSVERTLADIIAGRELYRRVMVSSFNPFSIRALRHFDRRIATAVIYSTHREVPRLFRKGAGRYICRPAALKPDKNLVNRWSLFFDKKIAGYPLITWTIDEAPTARRLLELGVDGIISNIPEEMLSVVKEYRA